MVSSCLLIYCIHFVAQLLMQELEEIFSKIEDRRHAVSEKVISHYKSLKNGKPEDMKADETGRKPLEGDWYIQSIE